MFDYTVQSCRIRFTTNLISRVMKIYIAKEYEGGHMYFESKNNSPWSCYYRANELSNFKLDNIFTNHILDKLWNESINNEAKKSE